MTITPEEAAHRLGMAHALAVVSQLLETNDRYGLDILRADLRTGQRWDKLRGRYATPSGFPYTASDLVDALGLGLVGGDTVETLWDYWFEGGCAAVSAVTPALAPLLPVARDEPRPATEEGR